MAYFRPLAPWYQSHLLVLKVLVNAILNIELISINRTCWY